MKTETVKPEVWYETRHYTGCIKEILVIKETTKTIKIQTEYGDRIEYKNCNHHRTMEDAFEYLHVKTCAKIRRLEDELDKDRRFLAKVINREIRVESLA